MLLINMVLCKKFLKMQYVQKYFSYNKNSLPAIFLCTKAKEIYKMSDKSS